jgi:hypothetical protein
VNSGPYVHQFPLRVAVGTGISLVEAPGHSVTVVGHEPKFDETRKLWYCDLRRSGSYVDLDDHCPISAVAEEVEMTPLELDPDDAICDREMLNKVERAPK